MIPSFRSFSSNQKKHSGCCNDMQGRESVRGGAVDITDWRQRATCRSLPVDVFFPTDAVGVEIARSICGGCAVKAACLEYALENREDHGVWGGTSERERRRILKARRQSQQ